MKKIEYCDSSHDSCDSHDGRVGITTYRNRPKCPNYGNFKKIAEKNFGSGFGRQGPLGHQKPIHFSFWLNENLHCLLGSPQR